MVDAERIPLADLAARLPEVLRRVREHGERFVIADNGEAVAELRPAEGPGAVTWTEFVGLLRSLPRPDDRFADDLEAIQASQEPVRPPPQWPG
jgi:antitoxin (DNA-binding transcriptional repressor) of toxin-antitoxin stability system